MYFLWHSKREKTNDIVAAISRSKIILSLYIEREKMDLKRVSKSTSLAPSQWYAVRIL